MSDRDNGLGAERHKVTKDAKHLSGVSESRLPVGSSARMTGGLLASARATATRCHCLPDNWSGIFAKVIAQPER